MPSSLGIIASGYTASAALAYVATADQWTAAATGTNACSVPAGTANGDLIMFAAFMQSNTDTLACAALGSPLSGPNDQSGGGVLRSYLWTRTASSEPASYTFTKTGTDGSLHVVAVTITGGSSAVDTYAARAPTGNNTTITLPSISVTATPTILVALMGYRGASNDVTTQPTGYTDRLSTSAINPANVAVSTLANVATGTIASDTAGRLNASAACSNFLVAVK